MRKDLYTQTDVDFFKYGRVAEADNVCRLLEVGNLAFHTKQEAAIAVGVLGHKSTGPAPSRVHDLDRGLHKPTKTKADNIRCYSQSAEADWADPWNAAVRSRHIETRNAPTQ